MTDHADVIREALWSLEGVFPGDYRLAALDALVAERDSLRKAVEIPRQYDVLLSEWKARVTELEAALLAWWEPQRHVADCRCTACRLTRAALAEEEVTPDSRDASGGAPVSRDARHPRSDTTALAAPTALPPPRNPGQNEYGGGALAALAKEDTDE